MYNGSQIERERSRTIAFCVLMAEMDFNRIAQSDKIALMVFTDRTTCSLWYDGSWTMLRKRHVPRALRAWLRFPINDCTETNAEVCACWHFDLSSKTIEVQH